MQGVGSAASLANVSWTSLVRSERRALEAFTAQLQEQTSQTRLGVVWRASKMSGLAACTNAGDMHLFVVGFEKVRCSVFARSSVLSRA